MRRRLEIIHFAHFQSAKILLGKKMRENFHLSRRIATDRMFRESGCNDKSYTACFPKHAIRCNSQVRMIFLFLRPKNEKNKT